MPGARFAIRSRVSDPATTSRSYATSSGPKQPEQTYVGPSASGRPQLRQTRPRMRGAAVWVGNGRISISVVIGGSRHWGDETGRNEKTLPPRKGLVKRRLISQEDLPGLGTLPALRR